MEFMAGRAHRAGKLIHCYLGPFDLLSEGEFASALRSDTPTLDTQVDVSDALYTIMRTYAGVSDRTRLRRLACALRPMWPTPFGEMAIRAEVWPTEASFNRSRAVERDAATKAGHAHRLEFGCERGYQLAQAVQSCHTRHAGQDADRGVADGGDVVAADEFSRENLPARHDPDLRKRPVEVRRSRSAHLDAGVQAPKNAPIRE
jgi:hypothetical protein